MERWQSGRSRILGKDVYGQPYRGFESPSLRRLELARDTMFRAGFVIIRLWKLTTGTQPLLSLSGRHLLGYLVQFGVCSIQ